METFLFMSLIICIALLNRDLSLIKKQLSDQQKQLDTLTKLSGHDELASDFLCEEDIENLRKLKQEGKTVEAVKLVRVNTKMSLLEAKNYVDDL